MSNNTMLLIAFIVTMAAALHFYQPVKISVYECSEHPDFHPSREAGE